MAAWPARTDPDARLYRKGPGKEAKLCFIGHGLMENRHGLLVDTCLTPAGGHAERVAALAKAHSFERRAAMSMARLWRDQGKPQQARELLAPVYGWFTEGFNTRDLKEAKTLLEELAA